MEISEADILEAVRATGSTKSFCSNQTYLTKKFGRKPNRLERLVLTNTLKLLDNALIPTELTNAAGNITDKKDTLLLSTQPPSFESTIKSENILVCTAYSSDYTIGSLCELVNKEYANKHG
jgi:hypothetical protein